MTVNGDLPADYMPGTQCIFDSIARRNQAMILWRVSNVFLLILRNYLKRLEAFCGGGEWLLCCLRKSQLLSRNQ